MLGSPQPQCHAGFGVMVEVVQGSAGTEGGPPPPPPLWAEEQVCREPTVSPAFLTLVPFHSLLLGTSSPERKLAALPRALGLAQPTASVLHVLWARWEPRAAVHTWRRLWGRPRAGGQLRRPHWALLLETAPWGAQWGFPLGYLQQE